MQDTATGTQERTLALADGAQIPALGLGVWQVKSGKELWETRLEYVAHAVPITYQGKGGKQYVAVMAGGAPSPGAQANHQALIVFALP